MADKARTLPDKRWGMLLLLPLAALLLDQYAGSLARRILPLKNILVQGADNNRRVAAERLLDEARGDNLFLFDVAAWRDKLEAVPGVRRAHLQRRLPQSLFVRLEASVPLARWHSGELIDEDGRRFAGNVRESLPVFRGDAARTGEMALFYRQARLLLPDGVAQVEVDARGDWRVVTADGIFLQLGRDPLPRLTRYAAHAARLHAALPMLHAVDMRYAQGFAARLRTDDDAVADAAGEETL